MNPEEHRKARAAHENALYRKIWLRLAQDCVLKGEEIKGIWEKSALWWALASLAIATITGIMGIWWYGIPFAFLTPEVLALFYSINCRKEGNKAYYFWLRVRQQRLDYAEMYR